LSLAQFLRLDWASCLRSYLAPYAQLQGFANWFGQKTVCST
jgi:hypothetical protein